jgi:hypothetical protein
MLVTGCASKRPLKGGKATLKPGVVAEMVQPENPAQVARQSAQNDVETVMMVPAGSKVTSRDISPAPQNPKVMVTNETVITVASNMVLTRRTIQRADSEIGAAQKDTARETTARLTAIRPLQMIGIVLLVAGVAMFHPAIRAFVGSGTLQVGCFAVGTGLIFLPMIVAGHETLVLVMGGAGVLALGVWFLAHRHGQLKGMVDANQNGIDDRIEAALAKLKNGGQEKT